MSARITESGDGLDVVAKSLESLKRTKVYVGIPQERSSSDGSSPTNAELLYIHTNGSPRLRIPARPIIEPAVEEHLDIISGLMRDAAIAAAEGDSGEADALLDDAGTVAENAAIKRFGSGALAPNAPITIEGGWMRNRISGKLFFVEGKRSSAPLIDTGSLKGSITHIVEKE